METNESQAHEAAPTASPTNESVAASVEQTTERQPSAVELPNEPSLHQKMKDAGEKNEGHKPQGKVEKADQEKGQDNAPANQPEPPKYEANYKYKAFGKEKELDPFFRALIKDQDSEKKVKEVFTRADAFDDMKGRFEATSQEFQKKAQALSDLDRDVKRVMQFRNSGDLDNFFASVQLSKQDIFNWAKRQLDLDQLSPEQQQAYQQGVQARAENVYNQQNYAMMQSQMADQRAQMIQIQLDHTLSRPEILSTASAWDAKMGDNAFRNLVIEEAAGHFRTTGQVWSPDEAVQNVRAKFGKLLETPQPQATAQVGQNFQGQPQAAPQVPQPVQVQGKPVIPNVQGRGTSPVKQKPKTLDDLRAMAKQAQSQESSYYE